MVDACQVAISEHGLVPSVQVARMTSASAPNAPQGAVAAGLLGCRSGILGAAEDVGNMLIDILSDSNRSSREASALNAVQQYRIARLSVPVFGHPLHKNGYPRAERLLAVAPKLSVAHTWERHHVLGRAA
ncbi:citrate/2-methylcitrate synthase [Burkholderia ubonensis]|uniref:citrate/2-methylcitrate synthase n=1 Tax=Burkholderia ubonensis TaxID=101571 RepID=UPI0038CD55F7